MTRLSGILQGALFALGMFFCFLGVMCAVAYVCDHLVVTCVK